MKRNPILRTLGSTIGAAVMLMALPAFAQKNPEREAYFGQTHVYTSWSFDAYIFGNMKTGPKGPFMMAMCLYWPKDEAVNGKWTAPPLQQAK
jgi:hypothetical protein